MSELQVLAKQPRQAGRQAGAEGSLALGPFLPHLAWTLLPFLHSLP